VDATLVGGAAARGGCAARGAGLSALFHARVHYPGAPSPEERGKTGTARGAASARGNAADQRRVHGEKSRLKIDHS